MDMTLAVIMGICWIITYIDAIRIGFRDKTYCIPLFALTLNMTWAAFYLYDELISQSPSAVQVVYKLAWFCLSIPLLITYLRYGKQDCRSDLERKLFVPGVIFALVVSAALQIIFFYSLSAPAGNIISSFLQNVLMSVLFIAMLYRRQGTKGQSMLIAVAKCLGTSAATIRVTLIGGVNPFVIPTGIIIFITDVIYIVLLFYTRKQENKSIA